MFRRAYVAYRILGLGGVMYSIRNKIMPDRLAYFDQLRKDVESRTGLEVGGPSTIFTARGCIPVYPIAGRIDNCNFGNDTVWEGTVVEGDNFVFAPGRPAGRQFVAEASDLPFIKDATYDFVLSSHCLEHLANPLRGLSEWIRVLKEDGLLLLVVPHKDGTFDHRRPVTSMQHLIDDYEAQMPEGDLTHLDEVLKLHDLDKDPESPGAEDFASRSRRNVENRCLHHHVFDARLAVAAVNHQRLRILAVELFRPFHIIVIARKVPADTAIDNDRFLGKGTLPAWTSPFPSDRTFSR